MKVPRYCIHKASGQAYVRLHGRFVYLGAANSDESRERYHQVIAAYLAGASMPAEPPAAVFVAELIEAFFKYAQQRYVKNGKPTSEVSSYRTALRHVVQLYGRLPVDEFGPTALITCRHQMILADYTRKRINQHVGRIRRVFKWGVSRELVATATWQSLLSVEGLRRGEAREPEPVRPVTEDVIAATLPFLSPQVRAMIHVQLWSACRPGEAILLRTGDIDKSGTVWIYEPRTHKTEHHDLDREIYFGPHAQEWVEPWLRDDPDAFMFQPKEAREEWCSARGRRLATNCRNAPRDHYDNQSYARAISRACKRARIEHWHPNQLRHAAATRIRRAYGIELARIILGHRSAVTSEIYAERDREAAIEAMSKLG